MNTQEILTRVCDAMSPFSAIEQAEDSRSYSAESVAHDMHERLNALRADLEAQLRLEIAASKGSVSATRTLTKLLERCKKNDIRPSLHYAWQDAEGRQCICDGYRAFRLKEPLPLEPRPADADDPVNLDAIMPKVIGSGYASIPLPSAKEIREHIAIEKARRGLKRGESPVWDFGPGKPAVNASYLLDLVNVFPDATEIFYQQNALRPLYVRCERGDAVLLPVKTARAVAEAAAQRKAEEDERRALEARAKELGIDPMELKEREARKKEREARKAKRKADAEKAFANRLEQIHDEMRRNPAYSMEPDEFAELVALMDEAQQVA